MVLSLLAIAVLSAPARAAPADPLTASLLSALPAVERCRGAANARKEVATGTLSVVIEPGEDGAYVGAAGSLELAPAMITCITDAMGTVRLPPVTGAHEATWSFPAKGPLQLAVRAIAEDAQADPVAPPAAPGPALLDSTAAFVVDPAVDAAVRATLPAVRACRDATRRSTGRADGAVTVVVYVLGGEPSLGPARSKTVDAAALACIDMALAGVRLPPHTPPAQAEWYLPLSGPVDLQFGRPKLVNVGPAYAAAATAKVAEHAPAFAECFLADPAATPGAVELAITGEGTVVRAGLGSFGRASGCLLDALRGLELAPFEGDSTVLSLRLDAVRPLPVPGELAPVFAGCLDATRASNVTLHRASPALAVELSPTPVPLPPNLEACLALARKALPVPDQLYFLAAVPQ